MKAEQRGIGHREVITNPNPREMRRLNENEWRSRRKQTPRMRMRPGMGMKMRPRMKGWNPDRDKNGLNPRRVREIGRNLDSGDL